MYDLLKLPKEEFNAIILNTAAKKGMSAAIVEKDFWVTVTLDYLFHHSKWQEQLVFKGGTCLSKVYHLIERFSEDIDLIIDWRVLGYSINEPWDERSNTKQQKFIEESKERLFDFLENDFLPEFKTGMKQLLGFEINAFMGDDDLGSVLFAYPSSYNDESILKVIKLEAGILASWIPIKKGMVESFVAEEYPEIVKHSKVELLATTPERTFWEKATILHQEAFRPKNSLLPKRYSRHYYDIYCMCEKAIADSAMQKPELLDDVSAFKMKFYPRGWARYDLAKFGTIRLLPAEHSIDRLKKDYADMKSMIYGEYPSFDDVLLTIRKLEESINNVK